MIANFFDHSFDLILFVALLAHEVLHILSFALGVPVLSSDGACSVKLLAQAPKIVPLFPHLKAVSEFEVRSVAKRSLDFGPDRNVVL